MKTFTNPLDEIKVASPCPADWEKMIGDARQRFCSECKLNVYNLSGMTRIEAESLLINSEGRLCVRFYRRADGTILTKNCPIGWAKVRQRVSKLATAAFSMIVGFLGGFTVFGLFTNINQNLFNEIAVEDEAEKLADKKMTGVLLEAEEITGEIPLMTVGQVIDPSAFSHIKKNRQKRGKY